MNVFSTALGFVLIILPSVLVPLDASADSVPLRSDPQTEERSLESSEEDRALAEHLAELLVELPYVDTVSAHEKRIFEVRFATIARQYDPSINLNLRRCVFASTTVAEAEVCFSYLHRLGQDWVAEDTSEDPPLETYSLGRFHVNPAESLGGRLLLMNLTVEGTPAALARVEARLPMIRHDILMEVGRLTVMDLEDDVTHDALRAEIERCIDHQIRPHRIDSVYFVELMYGS